MKLITTAILAMGLLAAPAAFATGSQGGNSQGQNSQGSNSQGSNSQGSNSQGEPRAEQPRAEPEPAIAGRVQKMGGGARLRETTQGARERAGAVRQRYPVPLPPHSYPFDCEALKIIRLARPTQTCHDPLFYG
jgi:hypothetical protein